ncbi:MAG TPA: hypothetical protein VHL08_04690 [Dongiaceae bacterium]|jgi:hypothetical protein|nr:hypothetical protein [Dongiaceae bacterium]
MKQIHLLASLLGLCLAAPAWAGNCRYDIRPEDPAAAKVEVTVRCSDPSLQERLAFTYQPAERFVTRRPDTPFRYEFALAEFARSESDYDSALLRGRSVMVSPDSFLPFAKGAEEALLFIDTDGGAMQAAPYERGTDGGYRIRANVWHASGAMVLGQFQLGDVPGVGHMRAALLDEEVAPRFDQLLAWLSDTGKNNIRFWHAPPIDAPLVILVPKGTGDGLEFGRVNAGSGTDILLVIGSRTTPANLYDQWIAVHEFLHQGTPYVRDSGAWLNEGIATYFEPLLRYRAHWKSEDDVWQEWIQHMPTGMRAFEQIGLRQAARGGVYWGGALFMLLADIGLREASHGRIGMEDCLVEVLHRLGNAEADGRTADIIATCDRMSGTHVVSDLALHHLEHGEPFDLDAIWARLGVKLGPNDKVTYDEHAPLAWLRHNLLEGNRRYFAEGIAKTMSIN